MYILLMAARYNVTQYQPLLKYQIKVIITQHSYAQNNENTIDYFGFLVSVSVGFFFGFGLSVTFFFGCSVTV